MNKKKANIMPSAFSSRYIREHNFGSLEVNKRYALARKAWNKLTLKAKEAYA